MDSQKLVEVVKNIINEKQNAAQVIAKVNESSPRIIEPRASLYKWVLYLLVFGIIFMLSRAFAKPPRQIQYDDMGYMIETQ